LEHPPTIAALIRKSEEYRLILPEIKRFRIKEEETIWPAPGSEDTELGVLMRPEVSHGEKTVYARVQA
jgi:hypothetical protein